ncbi:MAG: hypothetical protein EOO75_18220, partial [Myxococcales bacterium]
MKTPLVVSTLSLVSATLTLATAAQAQSPTKATITTTTTEATTASTTPVPGAPGTVAVHATTTTQITTEIELPQALHRGFEIGLRAGYALPLGKTAAEVKLGDVYAAKIPIQLDVGYRITPQVYLGAYGQYGIGVLDSELKDGCDAVNVDCSSSNIRFGVNATYHFLTRGTFLPWAGLGFGYEMAY